MREVNYPPEIDMSQRDIWLANLINQCLERGRRRYPEPWPGIFDREDIESAFLQGLFDGLCRVKWNIGDPIVYLLRSGQWRMRTERYRALKKKVVALCAGCGKELKWNEEPCHTLDGQARERIDRGKRDFHETLYGESNPNLILRERVVFVTELSNDMIESFGAEDEDPECEPT